MDKIRVAILFGGRSGEHQVSLASARSVMGALDPERYEIYPVGIDPSGRWIADGDPLTLLEQGQSHVPALGERAENQAAESDVPELPAKQGGALVHGPLIPGPASTRFPQVDVVIPVLHGTYGEDGTVQGLLELADVAYVGADVLGSAIGMDKVVQKAVLKAYGLPVVKYVAVLRARWQAAPEEVLDEIEGLLPYPMFTKPANAGSSVGVAKAHDRAELARGLALAARFDRKLLIEEGVDAREIECSVLGNDDPIASVAGEVRPASEFYDYSAKYLDGTSELDIPAHLTQEQMQEVQQLAIRAFQAIDCAGMARVDFFLERGTGRWYVNELNTIPGFTAISMYPKLWEASGLPYPKLLDRLVELALERKADKRRSQTTYDFDH
ncbi:MAG: D-alanine--D-alanine ligase family protein [Anaerolineae bacterium]|jgi:D-alanine-D-alanine ligase|nr:D-alanine--D-alanine ligase [Chloroflexota bacterium]